mgnify:CR=1 FL=1
MATTGLSIKCSAFRDFMIPAAFSSSSGVGSLKRPIVPSGPESTMSRPFQEPSSSHLCMNGLTHAMDLRSSSRFTCPKVLPRTCTLAPKSGHANPISTLTSVVFPAPLAPRIKQRSPRCTCQEILCRISCPPRYTLAFSTLTAGVACSIN